MELKWTGCVLPPLSVIPAYARMTLMGGAKSKGANGAVAVGFPIATALSLNKLAYQ